MDAIQPGEVAQAKALLRELDVDCWITFARESSINGDPTLVFLAPGHVTWHSAPGGVSWSCVLELKRAEAL